MEQTWGATDIPALHIHALLDGGAEEAWTSNLTGANKPHGTASVSNSENVTTTVSLGSSSVAVGFSGALNITISKTQFFDLLSADGNDEITLLLSATGNKNDLQLASLGNSSSLQEPTLIVETANASPPSSGTLIMLGSGSVWLGLSFLFLFLVRSKRA